ncbi:histidine kinase [Spirillospora sp. NPDC052269]
MPVVVRLRRWSGTWASDAVLAAAILLAQLWPLLSISRPGGGHWPWWGYAAVTASVLPLAFRRLAPVPVLILTVGFGTSYDLVSPLAWQPIWYGPILAYYTLATHSGRTARIGVITTQLVLTAVLRPSPDTLFRAVFMCITAYAVGRAVALGRAHAAALEDRAARAENERRLEAARAEAESERATAEAERAAAESRRATAEAERAVAEAERAAAAERARIARDMHDILAHAVSLMIVQAESGPLLMASDPERASAAFDAVAEAGRDAMTQLRRVLVLLKDGEDASRAPQPTLADLPELAGRVAGAGLAVEHQVIGEPRPLPPDVELAAYRIAQEALTNTVKHAGAEHVELTLRWHADALELTVRDDGRGAAAVARPGARTLPSGGNGLIGIRERAAACGGTAETGPRDDGRPGFTVHAVLPLPLVPTTPALTSVSSTATPVDGPAAVSAKISA